MSETIEQIKEEIENVLYDGTETGSRLAEDWIKRIQAASRPKSSASVEQLKASALDMFGPEVLSLMDDLEAEVMAELERRLQDLSNKQNFVLHPINHGENKFMLEVFPEQIEDWLDPVEGPFYEGKTIRECLEKAEQAAEDGEG